MAPHTYGEILARNLRAARGRIDIGQENVAARMRAMGFGAWVRQTVSKSEQGKRRLLAEEILGLALALETTIGGLLSPADQDQAVELQQGGPSVSAHTVRLSVIGRWIDGEITWDGDKPVITDAVRYAAERAGLDPAPVRDAIFNAPPFRFGRQEG